MSIEADCSHCYADPNEEHHPQCPAVMAAWDDAAWAQFVAVVTNGLGWAESEGMGFPSPHHRAAVLVGLSALIERFRS